jgi:hypothetical protein
VSLRNPGAVGEVSMWTWTGRSAQAPVALLAHGAGSRGDSGVGVGLCAAIAERSGPVVAFNFAYAEAGRRSPDRTERLLDCFRDVAAAVQRQFPGRPIVAGGRSMGGRMASLLAADDFDVAGLVLLNYPLIGIRGGADSPPRTDHWPDIPVPVLFVHGTRDRLFPAAVFEQSRGLLQVPTTVHVVDDADHMFGVPRRANRSPSDVYAEVADVVAQWSESLVVRT